MSRLGATRKTLALVLGLSLGVLPWVSQLPEAAAEPKVSSARTNLTPATAGSANRSTEAESANKRQGELEVTQEVGIVGIVAPANDAPTDVQLRTPPAIPGVQGVRTVGQRACPRSLDTGTNTRPYAQARRSTTCCQA